MPKSSTVTAPLFFWPAFCAQDAEVLVEGSEAAHALQVRRLRVGGKIQLTNGHGLLGRGEIIAVGKNPANMSVRIECIEKRPTPLVQRVLASALPKGDRQSVLLDMATQLGMDTFIPLDCEYSSVRFQPKMVERWMRVIQSACKQSRRVYFPKVESAQSLTELLDSTNDNDLVIFGDRGGASINQIAEQASQDIQKVILVVGPEGGFSAMEVGLLAAHENAVAVRAGDSILRTEAAGVALLAAINQMQMLRSH